MVKKLGFGLMRLPQDDGVIDIEQTKQMVDAFLERGFTYFDTAWMYCNFQSENVVKDVLVSRHPRDSFTLASKMHSAYFNNAAEREEIFNTQLQKTGAGYFDYYLLHALNRDMYKKHTELGSFEWLLKKQKDGFVKNIGFSFHDDAEFLDKILSEHKGLQFVQLQINYLDWESQSVQSRLCYETACKHGVPVIVMEPVKGGTLANVPNSVKKLFTDYAPDKSVASWAVRFAASLDNVMTVLSGMSSVEQLDDNTSYMQDFKPLSDVEMTFIKKATSLIIESKLIPCTACEYCINKCPQKINIPSVFSRYNTDKRLQKKTSIDPFECIECGACMSVCPQKLNIPELVKTALKHFEI